MLHTDVTKETENLMADRKFKTIGKCKCDDHSRNTDDCSRSGQANDKPRKRSLLIKSNPPGNESGNIQIVSLSVKNNEISSLKPIAPAINGNTWNPRDITPSQLSDSKP